MQEGYQVQKTWRWALEVNKRLRAGGWIIQVIAESNINQHHDKLMRGYPIKRRRTHVPSALRLLLRALGSLTIAVVKARSPTIPVST